MHDMTQVKEGDVLAGKYRVERVLGVGGMGVVVSALHMQLEERVAIKFLLPEALANPDAVARFGREARAAVKIKSEHVARVTDVGTLESGAPYMVMEYMHGRDLAAVVHDGGPLPVALAVEYVLQACEALAEAHHLGIVHRDLKPANLFLTTRADGTPSVKVLDFGISKVTSPDGSDMGMTKTQAIMGSPLYMSPEQMASSRDVDARSDIWAAGTVLYELVTGRVPFQAETMPQLCALILQHDPPAPRSFQPGIPEGLQQVILKALQKQRVHRYQNVAEFAMALAEFAPTAGPRSALRISRILSGGAPSLSSSDMNQARVVPSQPGAATGTEQAWGTTMTHRSSKGLWVAIGGLLVAAGVGAFFVVGRPSDPPAVSSEHAPAAPPPPVPADPAQPAAPEVAPVATAEPAPTTPASATPEPAPTAAAPRSTPRTIKKPPVKPTEKPAPSTPKTEPPPGKPFDPLSDRH